LAGALPHMGAAVGIACPAADDQRCCVAECGTDGVCCSRCSDCPCRCQFGESASSSTAMPRGVRFDARPAGGNCAEEGAAEEMSDEARKQQAPLREHFLSSAYLGGEDMNTDGSPYTLESTETRVVHYRHAESNIVVWHQAIYLAPMVQEENEVVFCYADAATFDRVTSAVVLDVELWSALRAQQPMPQQGGTGSLDFVASWQEPHQLSIGAVNANTSKYCIPIVVTKDSVAPMVFPSAMRGLAALLDSLHLAVVICRDRAEALANAAAHTEQRLRSVVSACEMELGAHHDDTLDSIGYLAYYLDSCGKLDQAEPLYRRALHGYEAAHGHTHDGALRNANNLAALLQSIGAPQEAEPLCKRALMGSEVRYGPDHPLTIVSINNLAHLSRVLGKLEEARHLFGRVLAWREAVLGPEHTDTLASMSCFAQVCTALGDLKSAETWLRRILIARETTLGSDHHDTVASVERYAEVLRDQDKLDLAVKQFQRVLQWKEKHFGATHCETAVTAGFLGVVQERAGEFATAVPLLQRALDHEKLSADLSPTSAQEFTQSLVRALSGIGNTDKADADSARLCLETASGSSKAGGSAPSWVSGGGEGGGSSEVRPSSIFRSDSVPPEPLSPVSDSSCSPSLQQLPLRDPPIFKVQELAGAAHGGVAQSTDDGCRPAPPPPPPPSAWRTAVGQDVCELPAVCDGQRPQNADCCSASAGAGSEAIVAGGPPESSAADGSAQCVTGTLQSCSSQCVAFEEEGSDCVPRRPPSPPPLLTLWPPQASGDTRVGAPPAKAILGCWRGFARRLPCCGVGS